MLKNLKNNHIIFKTIQPQKDQHHTNQVWKSIEHRTQRQKAATVWSPLHWQFCRTTPAYHFTNAFFVDQEVEWPGLLLNAVEMNDCSQRESRDNNYCSITRPAWANSPSGKCEHSGLGTVYLDLCVSLWVFLWIFMLFRVLSSEFVWFPGWFIGFCTGYVGFYAVDC